MSSDLATWATWIVWFALIYCAIGFLFALVFVSVLVSRLDPSAVGASKGFRLLILPGVAAFWPLFVKRLVQRAPPPAERGPHRLP